MKPPPVNLTNWPLWVAFCRESHEQLMESILATEDEAMPGDEAKIERKVCRDAMRYHGVESIKQKRVGWPDQLFLLGKGEVLYIEFKRPLEEPTTYQYHVLQFYLESHHQYH